MYLLKVTAQNVMDDCGDTCSHEGRELILCRVLNRRLDFVIKESGTWSSARDGISKITNRETHLRHVRNWSESAAAAGKGWMDGCWAHTAGAETLRQPKSDKWRRNGWLIGCPFIINNTSSFSVNLNNNCVVIGHQFWKYERDPGWMDGKFLSHVYCTSSGALVVITNPGTCWSATYLRAIVRRVYRLWVIYARVFGQCDWWWWWWWGWW